jgi:2-hydroxy-3-keto-5-methylthiopentenyl-1-phosphate phosphatase
MIEVFCDFDGTLTSRDTLDLLLERFAPPSWRELDRDMLAGTISEREGLKAEMALITAPDELLLETLFAEIQPAEGLSELMAFIKERGWPMTVLSGGLVRLAGALWNRWGYGDVPLLANDHRRNGRGGLEVIEAPTPRLRERCSHCKTWHLQQARARGATLVYVGDGLTDYCPAEAAQRRYAKGHLLEHLRRKDLEVIPFTDLREVAEDLAKINDQ